MIEERLRQADAGKVSYASEEEMDELYAEFNIPRPGHRERAAS